MATSMRNGWFDSAGMAYVYYADSYVFLGGNEKGTLEELEKELGQETIDLINDSKTYSCHNSEGVNYNKAGWSLLNVSELNLLERNKCIVKISGVRPFLSDMYSAASHPRYAYMGEKYGRQFDLNEYRKRQKAWERRAKWKSCSIGFEGGEVYAVL